MKVIRVHEIGSPDVLKYEDIPVPSPGPGQAQVRIEAKGSGRRRSDPLHRARL